MVKKAEKCKKGRKTQVGGKRNERKCKKKRERKKALEPCRLIKRNILEQEKRSLS